MSNLQTDPQTKGASEGKSLGAELPLPKRAGPRMASLGLVSPRGEACPSSCKASLCVTAHTCGGGAVEQAKVETRSLRQAQLSGLSFVHGGSHASLPRGAAQLQKPPVVGPQLWGREDPGLSLSTSPIHLPEPERKGSRSPSAPELTPLASRETRT